MIGLTQGIISEIQGAISKVGSTDKLKPIKNELPEEVSSNFLPSWFEYILVMMQIYGPIYSKSIFLGYNFMILDLLHVFISSKWC